MEQPEYVTTAAALKNLNPLKDSCERALALATLVNGKLTRTESSFQELVLVVEKHQNMYKLKTKKDLKKLLYIFVCIKSFVKSDFKLVT